MGLTRKATSISSGGLVDFRSDKEPSARYAKQARNEARKQTRVMQGQPATKASSNPMVLTSEVSSYLRVARA
jgi:hypothetical protein